MPSIKVDQLSLVTTSDPLPTVEVDTDSIPESHFSFDEVVANGLRSVAAKNPKSRATLYYFYSDSVNFHTLTRSVFIGLAGPKKFLPSILQSLKSVRGVRARFSDYISSSSASPMMHFQDGVLYRAEDPVTWYFEDDTALDADKTILSDTNENNRIGAPDRNDLDESQVEQPTAPIAARFRAARSDASVSAIKQTIERVFGLPEGSVLLCGPDGKPLRGVAKIATLRKRWEQQEGDG